MALLCRTMIGGKAFEITNGNGFIKLSSSANRLAGCRTNPTTNGWKRIAFSRYLKSLFITSFTDKADIQACICAYRTGSLTWSSQVFLTLAQPGTPALPGLMPFGNMPGSLSSPGRLPRLLWCRTCVGIKRLPAILVWQECYRSTLCIC